MSDQEVLDGIVQATEDAGRQIVGSDWNDLPDYFQRYFMSLLCACGGNTHFRKDCPRNG